MRLTRIRPCPCGSCGQPSRETPSELTTGAWAGIVLMALAGLLALMIGAGCAWLDDAAVAANPELDAKMQDAIAKAVAKATAEHREPTEAELVAAAEREVTAWQGHPDRKAAMTKALLKLGFKAVTGDPAGGLVEFGGEALGIYAAARSVEALAKVGVRRYRRRKQQPDAARGPPGAA